MSYVEHFVTCKWTPMNGYRSTYSAAQVNVLAAMLRRHYPRPHVLTCFTDDASGIDASVRVLPIWTDYASLPSPHGGKNPSCYRRLRLYSTAMKDLIGPRFLALDLDVVITGDLRPIVDRDEDIVLWGDTNPRTHYNGSMVLMTAGARRQVWEAFDPVRGPQLARLAGCHGSDQAWVSYILGPKEAKWTTSDGVYSYRNHIADAGNRLPVDARIVIWHGHVDPWSDRAASIPWVREHYRLEEVAA